VMTNKPTCYEERGPIPEIYSGTPTFMGLPKVTEAHIAEHDVIVMGMPWEGICTTGSFTGCELATKTIRLASLRYGGYLPEFDYDLFDYMSVGDLGDSAYFPGDTEKTFQAIQEKADLIYSHKKQSLSFGGDHSTTIPMLRSLCKHTEGNIGLIHFDAHLDNMPSYLGKEKLARCCPMHNAYEMGKITNIVHVGIRGPRNNFKGLDEAAAYKAKVISSFDVHRRGIENVLDEIKKFVWNGVSAVYITICSDVLDVSENPGGPADFAGLNSYQLLSMIHSLASEGIRGLDFVEIYPPQDHAGISSHAAAWAGIYGLSGMAKKHMKKQ